MRIGFGKDESMDRPMKEVIRTPYHDRTDREKLRTNWERTHSLMEAKQYSSAIVRAATCAEIAANIAVRAELGERRKLEPFFVDSLLLWANGLKGKFDRILIPLLRGTKRQKTFRRLMADIEKLNQKRNAVVHGGYVSDRQPALDLVLVAYKLCHQIVKQYQPKLVLRRFRTAP